LENASIEIKYSIEKLLYRVWQKYLTNLQNSCEWNRGVGNLSLSALLARLKAFQLQHSLPEYSVCEVASLVVNTFPQAFLEILHHSVQHVGRNCCQFFLDVLFQIYRCPWFLFKQFALEISSEEEVLRLGTLIPMNIEVPKKYQLSQDRIAVF
jgi:hypothetical protein